MLDGVGQVVSVVCGYAQTIKRTKGITALIVLAQTDQEEIHRINETAHTKTHTTVQCTLL